MTPSIASSDSSLSSTMDLVRASQVTLTNTAIATPLASTTPVYQAPIPTPAAPATTTARAVRASKSGAESESAASPAFCCLLVFLIAAGILGGSIYGIVKKTQADKAWEKEQLQAHADAAFEYAKKVAAGNQADFDARMKASQVYAGMLKEFADFKVAILAEMKAFRGTNGGSTNSTAALL